MFLPPAAFFEHQSFSEGVGAGELHFYINTFKEPINPSLQEYSPDALSAPLVKTAARLFDLFLEKQLSCFRRRSTPPQVDHSAIPPATRHNPKNEGGFARRSLNR